jgi:magnesium transporter
VVIRGLSTQRLQAIGAGRAVAREALAGLLLGLLLAAAVVPWAWLVGGNVTVAISAGFSLVVISTLAATAGSVLPLLFARLGLDPALMSAPFITTVVDVAGVFIYLQTASWLLQRAPTG